MAEQPADRQARLGTEIEAARAKLSARRDLEWAEAGDVMDGLSHDLNEATHLYRDDHEAIHAHYDRIEQRLQEAKARMGEDPATGG